MQASCSPRPRLDKPRQTHPHTHMRTHTRHNVAPRLVKPRQTSTNPDKPRKTPTNPDTNRHIPTCRDMSYHVELTAYMMPKCTVNKITYMCDRCIQYSAQNHLKGPPFLSKDGGGGSTPKNPKIPWNPILWFWVFLGFSGFNWIFLRTFFLKSYASLLAHCNVTLVDFKRYLSPFKICLGWFFWLRVYASQNGQKKETSLKTTKHVLSQFLFHKKLSLHSYFSSRGLIQSQNHFFFEKNWPENLPPKKHASQNGQIWISIIFWWRYFLNFYHHTLLENLLKNRVIT